MHSSEFFSSDASDDEDEEGGWLAHSTFDLGKPPPARRLHNNTAVSSSDGFDVRAPFVSDCIGLRSSHRMPSTQPLPPDLLEKPSGTTPSGFTTRSVTHSIRAISMLSELQDEGFGPFADGAGAPSSDIQFSTSFSSSFSSDDSFDFGEFHSGESDSAKNGEHTPTAGSWTFASGSETGDPEGDEFGNMSGSVLQTISLEEANGRIDGVRNGGWDS